MRGATPPYQWEGRTWLWGKRQQYTDWLACTSCVGSSWEINSRSSTRWRKPPRSLEFAPKISRSVFRNGYNFGDNQQFKIGKLRNRKATMSEQWSAALAA